jgi:hypothetical protein
MISYHHLIKTNGPYIKSFSLSVVAKQPDKKKDAKKSFSLSVVVKQPDKKKDTKNHMVYYQHIIKTILTHY